METKIENAVDAHVEIERLAKANANPEVRFLELRDGRLYEPKNGRIGETVRQGDIYIHIVHRDHPSGDVMKSRQLAIGNTVGSRHIAEAPADLREGTALPTWCDRSTFLGPRVTSPGRFTISHPEHARVSLPGGDYQITHQRDATSLNRVVD